MAGMLFGKGRRLFWIAGACALLLDQWSKALFWHHPGDGHADLVIIPHVLQFISHPGNRGGALGLPGAAIFYSLAGVAALGLIIFLLLTTEPERGLVFLALGLLGGGAVGNLVDRISLGFVRDFIDLHWAEAYHWYTFNIADSAICVGFALVILEWLLPASRAGAGKGADRGELAEG